jgi:hypothetical protein
MLIVEHNNASEIFTITRPVEALLFITVVEIDEVCNYFVSLGRNNYSKS